MTRKLLLYVFSILVLIVMLVASPLRQAAAQATETPTPTPKPTMTATVTLTPWPTSTAGATATPIVPTPDNSGLMDGILSEFEDPSADIKNELQGAVGVISGTTQNTDDLLKAIDSKTTDEPLTYQDSPFELFRGALIILSDMQWLMSLAGWFIEAFFTILAIMVIRLVISLWGVIDRLIAVIKLIPFV